MIEVLRFPLVLLLLVYQSVFLALGQRSRPLLRDSRVHNRGASFVITLPRHLDYFMDA